MKDFFADCFAKFSKKKITFSFLTQPLAVNINKILNHYIKLIELI